MSSRARASGGLAIFLLVSSIIPAAAQTACRCCELVTATNDIECGASDTDEHADPVDGMAACDAGLCRGGPG